MKLLRFGPLIAGLAGFVLAICLGAAATQPSPTVKIENFAYEPRSLTISVGTTVTWVNADDVPHTATAEGDTPAFDSKALDTDDKFSFTFTKTGTYPYYCKVHPHMKGVIIVQ
jgi:plastocyanin